LHIKWLSRVLIGKLTGKSDALFTSGIVINAFQKERFGKFGFKIDEILETIVPRKRKKHKMLYLT
jgi:hypothetical protein